MYFCVRVSWGMVLVRMLHSQSGMLHDSFSQSTRGTWEVFMHCFHSFLAITPYHPKQLSYLIRLSYINSNHCLICFACLLLHTHTPVPLYTVQLICVFDLLQCNFD